VDLELTVDGHRAIQLALRDLAEEVCAGRWFATGGGGYRIVDVVPRSWTHLLATAMDEPLSPLFVFRERGASLPSSASQPLRCPTRWEKGDSPTWIPWPDGQNTVDKAISETRRAVFPLLGLDCEM
jgi:acetoin utilization protein AcuC